MLESPQNKPFSSILNKYGRISEVIDENMKKFYEYEKEKYDFDSLSRNRK